MIKTTTYLRTKRDDLFYWEATAPDGKSLTAEDVKNIKWQRVKSPKIAKALKILLVVGSSLTLSERIDD